MLGAQPVWHPDDWAGIIAHKGSLRQQLARARNKGVTIVAWDGEYATNNPALIQRLHEWLARRGLPPMHFVVEPDTLGFLGDRRVFVAECDGLDHFKAKFQPASWEPVYAIAIGRHIPLHMLYAIAGVFGGTSPIWFVSQALGRAARQEGRWLQKRVQQ